MSTDEMARILCSRMKNRPWTLDPEDVYQEAYVRLLQASERWQNLNSGWDHDSWCTEMVHSCLALWLRAEQMWASRRLLDTNRTSGFTNPGGMIFGDSWDGVTVEDDIDSLDVSFAVEDLQDASIRKVMRLILNGWSSAKIARFLTLTVPEVSERYQAGLEVLRRIL